MSMEVLRRDKSSTGGLSSGPFWPLAPQGWGQFLPCPCCGMFSTRSTRKPRAANGRTSATLTDFADSKEPVRKTITFTQRDGWREVVSAQSVYVSRAAGGQLNVLSAICPHLGCSVSWQANHDKFVCPCHGGEFKADGLRISGPPPRAMDPLHTQVKDGKLQVRFEYFRSNVPNQETLS